MQAASAANRVRRQAASRRVYPPYAAQAGPVTLSLSEKWMATMSGFLAGRPPGFFPAPAGSPLIRAEVRAGVGMKGRMLLFQVLAAPAARPARREQVFQIEESEPVMASPRRRWVAAA
jgi:hypothetical protein